jgi:multidrug efflux pump subunit AcrA (membrane-fusion protein)
MRRARRIRRALALGSTAVLAAGCAASASAPALATTDRSAAAPPGAAPATQSRPPIAYDTMPVVRGTVTSAVICAGLLVPGRLIDVTSPGSGRIDKVYVDAGDPVRQGQLLARLDANRAVLAPADGMVLAREIEPGQVVAAGAPAPTLFRIGADLAVMKLDVPVSLADAAKLAIGQRATVQVDIHPQDVFTGTVVQIDGAPGSGSSPRVTLAVANDSLDLRPGMTATATIETAVRTNVLLAPASALQFRASPGRTTVWKIALGSTRTTPTEVDVKVGITDGSVVEIVDGVREGDRVATGSH